MRRGFVGHTFRPPFSSRSTQGRSGQINKTHIFILKNHDSNVVRPFFISIFQEFWVNIIPADALVAFAARASAGMIFTQDPALKGLNSTESIYSGPIFRTERQTPTKFWSKCPPRGGCWNVSFYEAMVWMGCRPVYNAASLEHYHTYTMCMDMQFGHVVLEHTRIAIMYIWN